MNLQEQLNKYSINENRNNDEENLGFIERYFNQNLIVKKVEETEIYKDSQNMVKKFIYISILIIIIFSSNIIFYFKNNDKYVNLYIVAHKDFTKKITNTHYKIACDNKEQLKDKYALEIIETYQDNELYFKKRGYGEGSKIYYIWKKYQSRNISSQYVGFNHYSRIFPFRNHIPNLNKIFNENDAIVNRIHKKKLTIRESFGNDHFENFLDECIEIIKDKYPEYYPTALKTINKYDVSFCNIFIMKEADFIKYGEFVFGILLEFDKRHNLINDDDIKSFISSEIDRLGKKNYDLDFQSRQEGFILERISNIFYNYHFKKMYEIYVPKKLIK